MAKLTPQRAAQQLEVAERRREVLALRVGGASMEEIGRALNLSKSTVKSHIDKALAELAKADLEQTARYRALNLQRLERLLRATWVKATADAPDPKLVREARSLIIAMNRLLGLEAPLKVAHTDPTGEHERNPADWYVPMPPERNPHEWAAETQAMLRDREATADRLVEELLGAAAQGKLGE